MILPNNMELPKSLIEKLKREPIDEQKKVIIKYLEENNRNYQLLLSLQQQEPKVRRNLSGFLDTIDDAINQIQASVWYGHNEDVRINPAMIAEHKKQEVKAYLTTFEEIIKPYFETAAQIPETLPFTQDLNLSMKQGDLNDLKSKVKNIELKVGSISLIVPISLDDYLSEAYNSL
jgi:hypothetical protein